MENTYVKNLTAPVNYILMDNVSLIDVNTSSGGLTVIRLQKINPNYFRNKITVNDVSNNASVGNILIQCDGGNLINNAPSLLLNKNGIVAEIEITDRNNFIANLNTDADAVVSSEYEFIAPSNTGKNQTGNWKFVVDSSFNFSKLKCTAPSTWQLVEINTFIEIP